MTTATRSAVTSEYDLLRGGSDLLDVALLAARSSAAARRLGGGHPIDSEDEFSLAAVAELLEASATSVKSFGPEPRSTAPPSGALAAHAEVAIEAVLQGADSTLDVESLSNIFEHLALQVREVISSRDARVAEQLVDVLARLASSVLRETGHVGENTSTL